MERADFFLPLQRMNSKEQYLSQQQLQQNLPIFCQPWWLDIVSNNWDVVLAKHEGKITGIWPFSMDKRWGLNIVRNPLLTPYLGPFFFYPDQIPEHQKTAFEESTFKAMWQQLPRWDSFDMEATTSFTHYQLFLDKGFEHTPKITYEIDLGRTEEKLFAAINSNHRNLIKQASQSNEIVEGNEYLPFLLQLHKETFSRKNKPYPFQPSVVEKLVKESQTINRGSLFAMKDGQNSITAGIFTVWDKEKMYLLLSAVDVKKAHPGAVRSLIWHAIKTARSNGLKTFDFEGSMDPGIAAFFKRFGGERKTYLCASKNKSVLWKIKQTLLG